MTAEIAIMNLQAVALAADSALTADNGGSQKIFPSANKLFALSDIAPVGILIYGNANFMSIPWETIVKEYRRTLGRTTFDRLNEYTDNFCQYLTSNIGTRVSGNYQIEHACDLVLRIFEEISQEIKRRTMEGIGEVVDDSGQFDMQKVAHLEEKITVEVINEYHSRAKKASLMHGVSSEFEKSIRKLLAKRLREKRLAVFKEPLHRGLIQKLYLIAVKSVVGMFDDTTADSPSGLTSGVVVAGFGERDIFPAISCVFIEGMIQGILKRYPEKREVALHPDNPSMIIPFAQTDMVYQFMEGIAPSYLVYLHSSVLSQLRSYTNELLTVVNQNIDSEIDIESLNSNLKDYHEKLANSFVENVGEFGKNNFSQPIVEVVNLLPKEQLADMAESLVNLTALKKRVSNQDETVGGPTDVALITKGDGLIWIKRKHYFNPELNPSYFAKTSFRRTRHGSESTTNELNESGEAR